ncbi:MAG: PaaI family thioesterase [Thermoplasmata archaeon]|nr:PaaI family thioesterase [Thermoplasmata archaeon]MCI4359726.1 PaaI family thioesterase [Thermoplasmata archaeon]
MSSARETSAPRPVRIPVGWADRLGGFHQEVGFRVDPGETRDGHCVVGGRVEARHLNINGVVHGGVYATILDTAMGGAVVTMLDEDETTATTSLYVEFLRPAREGQVLRARGEVVRRGRHLAFVEGNLLDGDGTRLSQAHGTWYIWSASDPTWKKEAQARTDQSTARRRRS